jgi:formylglycine-generating enzyme required for sulfatase activity
LAGVVIHLGLVCACEAEREASSDARPPPEDSPLLEVGSVAPDAGPSERDARVDAASSRVCVQTVQVGDLEVFVYEASRQDATGEVAGIDGRTVCSRPGVLPWTLVTQEEAEAACASVGFALCSNAEWLKACSGEGAPRRFPYGEAHAPHRCNDHVSGDARVRPAGAFAECVTPEGTFDLSGNVWERTRDGQKRGASFRVNAVTFHVEAAQCDAQYFAPAALSDDDLGFRCCRSSASAQAMAERGPVQ